MWAVHPPVHTGINVSCRVDGFRTPIPKRPHLCSFFSAPVKLKFLIEPFNIIDIISIVPWYIITFVGADFNGTTVFRVARLFRVFRVFKLGGRCVKLRHGKHVRVRGVVNTSPN